MKKAVLENNFVKLSPFDLGNYRHLSKISGEENLLYYSPSNISTPEALKEYVENAVDDYYHKASIPYIVFDKTKMAYAGRTRFGLINWTNKVMHIGWTWIGSEFQGTQLNKNMKFLMLQYVFETLAFEKVEFRIDERNGRSRKAVEKIGGKLEGTLRKDTMMLDGFRRSTCCYGILIEEWSEIKNTVFEGFN